MKLHLRALAIIVAPICLPFALQAQVVWDNGAGNGTWGGANNWNPDGVPANSATLTFGDTGVGSVSAGGTTRTAASIAFSNTSGSYDLTGGGATGTFRSNSWINSSNGTSNTISGRLASNNLTDNTVGNAVFSGTGNSTLTISGAIINVSAVRFVGFDKTSSGTLIISGGNASTYSGNSTISAGLLQLSRTAGVAAISGEDRVSGPAIDPTLTVSGTGTVQWINSNQVLDNVKMALGVGGTFNLNGQSETVEALSAAAGSGSRTLTLGNGTLATTAGVALTSDFTLNLTISSLVAFGQLNAGSTFAAAGILNVTNAGHSFLNGDSFDLFDGTISGTFSGGVSLPSLGGGLSWNQDNLYTTGTITVVPEPGTLWLAALGIAGLGLRLRRKA